MASQVLERLTRAGLRVNLRSDGRIVVGPREAITPELDAAIRTHRDELVEALRTAAWDDAYAETAIAETLARIEAAFPEDATLGATHGDQRLVDLHEAVNTAARRRDRRGFDSALADYERHVVARYGAVRPAGTAA